MIALQQKIITVFGGTGFLGSYVVQHLASRGYRVQVVSRRPERGGNLRTCGVIGQIVLREGDVRNEASVQRIVEHSHAVINLVGILHTSGQQSFSAIHSQGAERLAKLSKQAGVERFIHISALGIDKAAKSRYAKSKLNGEKAVSAAFPGTTILRPSIMFGVGDHFFNKFAAMAQYSPFLPLIGGGKTRFQPVYAGDVADAITHALENETTMGQCYELGGPRIYTFRELLEYIRDITRLSFTLVPVPFPVAGALGKLCEILPNPPLTYDQVTLLHYDNVVQPGTQGFAMLGITPTAVDSVVPVYLQRFRKGGQFATWLDRKIYS